MALTGHLVLPLPDRRDARPAPAGMAVIETELQNGLPARIPLAADLGLVVSAPTGAPSVWMTLSPGTVVLDIETEADPIPPGNAAPAANPLPLRLLLMRGSTPIAAAPARLGLRLLLPEAGPPAVELALLACRITAGAVRGLPLTGATLRLAWRRYGPLASDPPPPLPVRPGVLRRLAIDPEAEAAATQVEAV